MNRFFILALLASLILVSCKKNYTCTCTQTSTTTAYIQYGVHYPQKTDASTFKNTFKNKKDVATSNCKNLEQFRMDSYGSGESFRTVTQSTTCELF